ncbi:hypothetical protein A9Q98_11080 [Thalassotalea sp. 42_200_T64]|nr:hypothetical protein A9Q98_11080 [Thalassotalea sp. 42_200_T64]
MIKSKLCIFPLLIAATCSNASSIEDKISQCQDCHGKNGVSVDADVPTIAGYSETSLTDMLFAFQDEIRPEIMSKYRHGDTSRAETSMTALSKELREEDIEAIAVYFSEQTFVAATQPFDAALVKKGQRLHDKRCVKCHEDGGSSADDDSGILAGQWSKYLRSTFVHFKSGERESEEEMIKKIKKLSDKQIESLIHYYASLQG